MGWDGVNTWTFDISASAWAGGIQSYEFETDNFYFLGELWTYPLWWDIAYAEFSYDYGLSETCFGMYSNATLLEFFLDFTVGVNSCYTGFYDYFLADVSTDYTCEMVYYGFSDILNTVYDAYSYSMWPNNCDSADALWYKILNPSGPTGEDRIRVHAEEEEMVDIEDNTNETVAETADENPGGFF